VLRGSQGTHEQLQGIRGYISEMMILNFVYYLIKGIMFVKNKCGASLIGGILYFV
jgi:hypothetical protein